MGNLYAGRLVASAHHPRLVADRRRRWRSSRGAAGAVLVAGSAGAGRARLVDAERPDLDPVRYVALRVLDDAAYGAGVWQGAITHRSIAA